MATQLNIGHGWSTLVESEDRKFTVNVQLDFDGKPYSNMFLNRNYPDGQIDIAQANICNPDGIIMPDGTILPKDNFQQAASILMSGREYFWQMFCARVPEARNVE